MRSYIFKVFFVAFFLVCIGSISTYFWQKKKPSDISAQKINFIKPDYKPTESKNLIRVEIDVRDDINTVNGKVKKDGFPQSWQVNTAGNR